MIAPTRFVLSALLLALAACLFATAEELPDVEITGPSELKSIMAKKGIGGNDLLLPDVVDSLKPVFPQILEIPAPKPEVLKNFLHLSADHRLNLLGCFLSDRFLGSPLGVRGRLQKHSLSDQWHNWCGELIGQYFTPASRLSFGFKKTDVKSEFYSKAQSVSVLGLNYDQERLNLFQNPSQLRLGLEMHNCRYRYLQHTEDRDEMLLNANLGLSTRLKNELLFSADAWYSYDTATIQARLDFPGDEYLDALGWFRSVSLVVSGDKIAPGIHLSKRFHIDNENLIQVFQKSDFEIMDNYKLLLGQPWQQQHKDALVSLRPLNAHLLLASRSFRLAGQPVQLSLDYGIQYVVDEYMYFLTPQSGSNDLPLLKEQNVLRNNVDFILSWSAGASRFSQSCLLDKGWQTSNGNHDLPYVPFVSLLTQYTFSAHPVTFDLYAEQCFLTEDEDGADLDGVMDIGARAGFSLSGNLDVFACLINLLNRGRRVHRNVDPDPTSISLGFQARF